MSRPILIVGSVALDTIHNCHGSHERILGGSATYASLAASFFSPACVVAVIGHDFPDESMRLLRERQINLEGLEVANGKTFFWEGRYSDDFLHRTTLLTELNVFADFQPKIPHGYLDAQYLMLGNIDPELQLHVLDQVKSPRVVVADTMNYWIEGKPRELKRVLERVHVLVINEEEARQLSGAHNIVKVAKTLIAMGPKIVVIKRGEYGALLFENGDVFCAPAYPVEGLKDPTGAGDTFAGALLGVLAKEERVDSATLRRAVIYGSAVASLCVEHVGVKGLESHAVADIEQRFKEFRRLAHFASTDEISGPAN